MKTLPEYLTQKFLDWQATEGARKTLEDFAVYLDVNRSLLSYWTNGKRIPNEGNIKKVASKLGNEIYDVMGLPRPNPYKQVIDRVWEFLPEDFQRRISEEAEAYEEKNISERVYKTSKRGAKAKAK